MNPRCLSVALLSLLFIVFALATVGTASTGDTWIDQLNNTVLFYQQGDPHSDWQPYLDKVATIRDGLAAHDEGAVQPAAGELIRMLTTRANGIHEAAAEDLIQMMTSRELQPSFEMPVSVPDHAINTPYDGGRYCAPDGCDYWRDDVFDAGAG
jgi:hypothetical protein